KQFLTAAQLTISLQLSEKQWVAPGLPETLQAISKDFRWRIQGLVLEIDHTVLNRHVHWSTQLIQRLQGMGIRVQICNFIPTHSALAAIKYFQIKAVKIDQNFLRNLAASQAAQVCFRSVLDKFQQMKVDVSVPCIESPEQVRLLTQLNCKSWRAVCATPISPREATLLIHADSKLAQANVTTYLSAMNRLSQFVQQYLGLTVVSRYWQTTCPGSEWLSSEAVSWQKSGQFHTQGDFCLSSGQIQDIELWVNRFMANCSRIIRDLPDLIHASGLTLAETQLLRLQEP
ncbi:MAG: EAL domain-containing protein, partial [Cyanobacteria bacterium J06632_22]